MRPNAGSDAESFLRQEISISDLMKKLDILGDNAVSVCRVSTVTLS